MARVTFCDMLVLNADSLPTANDLSFLRYNIRPPVGDNLSFRPVNRARRRTHHGFKDGKAEGRESGELNAVDNLTARSVTVALEDGLRLKVNARISSFSKSECTSAPRP